MKNHALICKFIGIWPSEKELLKWIQTKWQPKGHIDLKLGAKGFFTVIFSNLEDKERIFEGGPYFYNNAGLFLRQWEEFITMNRSNQKLLLFGVITFLPLSEKKPCIAVKIGPPLKNLFFIL